MRADQKLSPEDKKFATVAFKTGMAGHTVLFLDDAEAFKFAKALTAGADVDDVAVFPAGSDSIAAMMWDARRNVTRAQLVAELDAQRDRVVGH